MPHTKKQFIIFLIHVHLWYESLISSFLQVCIPHPIVHPSAGFKKQTNWGTGHLSSWKEEKTLGWNRTRSLVAGVYWIQIRCKAQGSGRTVILSAGCRFNSDLTRLTIICSFLSLNIVGYNGKTRPLFTALYWIFIERTVYGVYFYVWNILYSRHVSVMDYRIYQSVVLWCNTVKAVFNSRSSLGF